MALFKLLLIKSQGRKIYWWYPISLISSLSFYQQSDRKRNIYIKWTTQGLLLTPLQLAIPKQAGKKQHRLFCHPHSPRSRGYAAFRIHTSINARTETIQKGFLTPLIIFFTLKCSPFLSWTDNPPDPKGFGTHRSSALTRPLQRTTNPTYFHHPIGIPRSQPPFSSLHPLFSFQRPLPTKTTRLEAPALTKSFQWFLTCSVSSAE